MWLASSLIFSPYIFLLRFPRRQNFDGEKEGAFPSPKYSNRGVLTIYLSCLYFKKFISRGS